MYAPWSLLGAPGTPNTFPAPTSSAKIGMLESSTGLASVVPCPCPMHEKPPADCGDSGISVYAITASISVKLRPHRSIHSILGLNFNRSVLELKCAMITRATLAFPCPTWPLDPELGTGSPLGNDLISSHGFTTRKYRSSQLRNGPRSNPLPLALSIVVGSRSRTVGAFGNPVFESKLRCRAMITRYASSCASLTSPPPLPVVLKLAEPSAPKFPM